MSDRRFPPVKERDVRRAARRMAKRLGKSPAGRIASGLLLLVLAVAAWAGPQLASSGGGSPDGSGARPTASAGWEAVHVTEDARRAAEQDAKRSTDVQRANADPAAFDQVTVRHVVDGDTLAVIFADGERASVRLIGIDTPESVAPQKERNREEGVWASDHMKGLVGEGDTLWLQHDTNQIDKYGRPLAYVWRALPASAAEADDPAVIARDMLNAIQVIDGYGQPKTYRPDTYHDSLFAQWGVEAAAEGRGVTYLWA